MPDCALTFEQREYLSWYQLNAYFCPERVAPELPCEYLVLLFFLRPTMHSVHRYFHRANLNMILDVDPDHHQPPSISANHVLCISDSNKLPDSTASKTFPTLRTSRNRIRIQDLRSASISTVSRTSSPDTKIQQSALDDLKVHPDVHDARKGMSYPPSNEPTFPASLYQEISHQLRKSNHSLL
jgi:hypothetical protein